MDPTAHRFRNRLAVMLALLVVSVFAGRAWLEHLVLERSERIVAQLSGPRSRIAIGKVDIQLLSGNIRWSDVSIEQPEEDPDTAERGRSMRVSGHVDGIAVRGLSLWRLLVAGTLSMRSLAIIHPDIEMILMNDTSGASDHRSGKLDILSFNTDTLEVGNAVFRMHYAGDSAEFSWDTLDLHVTGLRSRWSQDDPFELRYGAATGQVRGIHATLPPLQDLHVASIVLEENGRRLQLIDLAIRPLKGPQEYDAVVSIETDLFDAHLDTATIDDLDLASLIDRRALSAASMRIAGVDLDVYRDKTLPDDPFVHKALPARLLRELPFTLCMDSLVVDRWNVHYHEKDIHSPQFGEVLFTDIHAVVKGLCTVDTSSRDTMHVMATARGYDKAEVALEVRTVIADRSDRFTVNAKINGLPFDVFNRMTADLMLLRATAGTIGGVDLTMTADDDRATGRVDMEYDALTLELIKQDGSGGRRKFMSGLLNQMVHARNLRSAPGFRHGDFSFARRKDRSIFNYLWSGLREGMIATVLPGVLENIRQLDQPSARNQ